MRTTRLWSIAAAAAVMLTVPVTANAAMTTSQVTSPSADPFYVYDDKTDASEVPITVTGTSNATPGELADIICTYDTSSDTLANDVVVGAGGAVTGTGNVSDLTDNACRLRIVPDGVASELWFRFDGPVVAPQLFESSNAISGGPNDGKRYDWDSFLSGPNGELQLTTVADGAIEQFYPYTRSLYDNSDTTDDALYLTDRFADGSGDHSSILVDGKNAYTPYDAEGLVAGSDAFAGWQPVTSTTSIVDGVPTVTESFPLVACTANDFPATALSCTNFVPTGVTYSRTYRLNEAGGAVRVQDSFTSTDSATHRVQLWYEFDHDDDSDTQWMIDEGSFEQYSGSTKRSGVQLPTAPFTVFGRDDEYPLDSADAGTLAVTFGTAPGSLVWYDEDVFDASFDVSVPASGSASLWFSVAAAYAHGRTVTWANRAEDAFGAPTVAFTSPLDGASFTTSEATIDVTGTASDSVGVSSVTLNGAATTLSGGNWSTSVTLQSGSNTLTAVAKDAAGNEATATITVTFTPPRRFFTGNSGNNKLVGNSSNNILKGGGGNDRLFCGVGGRDVALGGVGNDFLSCVEPYAMAQANRDVVNCGDGAKDVALVDPFDRVLNCENFTRVWIGDSGVDNWTGKRTKDRFIGKGGADRITCGGGRDNAITGAGNDFVDCFDAGSMRVKWASRDVINCGAGKDRVIVDMYDKVVNCETVVRR